LTTRSGGKYVGWKALFGIICYALIAKISC